VGERGGLTKAGRGGYCAKRNKLNPFKLRLLQIYDCSRYGVFAEPCSC
jgi:hypothetical protein